MGNIIVTVTDSARRFLYDIEVPVDVPVEHLREDIAQTINGYRPDLFMSAFTQLFSNRLKRLLNDSETLASAGVLNGDYITLREG